MSIPVATHSTEIVLFGLTMRVHQLDNGERVIEADDVYKFMAWMEDPERSNEELHEAALKIGAFIRGEL